ncbi:MAG: hypothetical protein P1V20_12960 [Verrucomicrobiales bacterium]|nr:hypothetical protein [Verrucomicrobiales bacterium]
MRILGFMCFAVAILCPVGSGVRADEAYIPTIAADCFIFESRSEKVLAEAKRLLIGKIKDLKFSGTEAPLYIPDDHGGKKAKTAGKWFRLTKGPDAESHLSLARDGHQIHVKLWIAVSNKINTDRIKKAKAELGLIESGFELIGFMEEIPEANEAAEQKVREIGHNLMVTRRMISHRISQQ